MSSWLSGSESRNLTDFTVAAFNCHWGIGSHGRSRGARFDVARVVRGFNADIVVVPETYRDENGVCILDPLRDEYHVETLELEGWAANRFRRP